jgi:hypothetical protein
MDQAVVLEAGTQPWQTLAGLTVDGALKAAPMKQPALQELALQTWPVPQGAPSASALWAQAPELLQVSLVQRLPSSVQAVPWESAVQRSGAVVEQCWHPPLAGSTALAATNAPAMKHPVVQAPPVQNWALPQEVPSGRAGCAQAPAPSQASAVQELASAGQVAPLAALDQAVAQRAGSRSWQGLAGLSVPGVKVCEAMTQLVPHWPLLHCRAPPPQGVLSVTGVCTQVPAPSQASVVHSLLSVVHAVPGPRSLHAVRLVEGVHASQAPAGFFCPEE